MAAFSWDRLFDTCIASGGLQRRLVGDLLDEDFAMAVVNPRPH